VGNLRESSIYTNQAAAATAPPPPTHSCLTTPHPIRIAHTVGWLKAQLHALVLTQMHRFERFEYSTSVNCFNLAHSKTLRLLT
jgi:hypothetical protein